MMCETSLCSALPKQLSDRAACPICVDYQQFDISKHLQNLVKVIAPAGYDELAGGGGLDRSHMENILNEK